MKNIFLIQAKEDSPEYNIFAESFLGEDPFFVDTTNLEDENKEYQYIWDCINNFSKQEDTELMIIYFSGRDSVVSQIGDDYTSMIVTVSLEADSKYYLGDVQTVSKKLYEVFIH